jgi:hypothetical protein
MAASVKGEKNDSKEGDAKAPTAVARQTCGQPWDEFWCLATAAAMAATL